MDVKYPEIYRKLLRIYDTEMRKELDITTLVKTLETLKTVSPIPALPPFIAFCFILNVQAKKV